MSLRPIICSVLLAVSVFSMPANGQQDFWAERTETYKKRLDFSNWGTLSKDGLHYYFIQLHIPDMMREFSGIQSTCDTIRGTVRYTIQYSKPGRIQNDRTPEDLQFSCILFPTIGRAHEFALDILVHSSAPLDYSLARWEKENVAFGDISFGKSLWIMGNMVVRQNNRDYDTALIREFYSAMENHFRQKDTTTQSKKVIPAKFDENGNAPLDTFPESATVFVTTPVGYNVELVNFRSLKADLQSGAIDPDKIRINIINNKDWPGNTPAISNRSSYVNRSNYHHFCSQANGSRTIRIMQSANSSAIQRILVTTAHGQLVYHKNSIPSFIQLRAPGVYCVIAETVTGNIVQKVIVP